MEVKHILMDNHENTKEDTKKGREKQWNYEIARK